MSSGQEMEASGNSDNNARRCAACKYLRRRCSHDCVLAPYFPSSDPHRYACVQRVFGAGNIARMLQQLPVHERGRAADAMAVEAYRRVQDPVYGCAGVINRLQEEIGAVQCELARTQAQIALHSAAAAAHATPPVGTQEDARSPPLREDGGAPVPQEGACLWLSEYLPDF